MIYRLGWIEGSSILLPYYVIHLVKIIRSNMAIWIYYDTHSSSWWITADLIFDHAMIHDLQKNVLYNFHIVISGFWLWALQTRAITSLNFNHPLGFNIFCSFQHYLVHGSLNENAYLYVKKDIGFKSQT